VDGNGSGGHGLNTGHAVYASQFGHIGGQVGPTGLAIFQNFPKQLKLVNSKWMTSSAPKILTFCMRLDWSTKILT
jgi:hypothetical protein